MLYSFFSSAPAEEGLHLPTPPAEVLFYLFGVIPIRNTILTAWLVMAVLLLVAWLATRNLRAVPSGLQNFMEAIIEVWQGLLDQTMGRRGRRFLPLIATAFLFILFANWIAVLPLKHFNVTDAAGHKVQLFRAANSDLNVTAAMAVLVILVAEFMEFRSLGAGNYFKSLLVPNFLRWLEIFTRPLSMAFRLFGNIFAGSVLIAVILYLAPYVVFPFLGLELFVGLIQALIFSMLTLVFLTIATAHAHHDEHPAEHGEHARAEAAHGGASATAPAHAPAHGASH